MFPEAAGRAGEGGASSVLTCSLGRVCFGKGPKEHRAAGAASAPRSSVGSTHCPSEGPRHRQYPSHRRGVTGCSPAVLAATTSCRAVTHGWRSLGAAPLLTAPVPVIQLAARSPSDGRNGAAVTLPRAEPVSNLFWVCAPRVSLGLLGLSLRFSHIPLHSPGELLTAVGRDQDLGLFLPRCHHCMIPSCLIPALLTAP